jgi:hypothetical protein
MSLVSAVARFAFNCSSEDDGSAGDSIATPPFGDGQEAIDAWTGKDNPSPRGFFAFLAAKYASKAVMSAPTIMATLLDNSLRQVFVLALRHQLPDHRLLRSARRAPVCAEIEQYRLALGRKLVEFGLTVRLDLARKRRVSGD